MTIEEGAGYDRRFYEAQAPGGFRSAEVILSHLFRSVVDVSCTKRVVNAVGLRSQKPRAPRGKMQAARAVR